MNEVFRCNCKHGYGSGPFWFCISTVFVIIYVYICIYDLKEKRGGKICSFYVDLINDVILV